MYKIPKIININSFTLFSNHIKVFKQNQNLEILYVCVPSGATKPRIWFKKLLDCDSPQCMGTTLKKHHKVYDNKDSVINQLVRAVTCRFGTRFTNKYYIINQNSHKNFSLLSSWNAKWVHKQNLVAKYGFIGPNNCV